MKNGQFIMQVLQPNHLYLLARLLDDEQYEILQSLKGFGKKDAEKIRNILIAYLSEKSYLKASE